MLIVKLMICYRVMLIDIVNDMLLDDVDSYDCQHVIGRCFCRNKLPGNKTSKIPIPVSGSKSPRSSVVETLPHMPRYPTLLYPIFALLLHNLTSLFISFFCSLKFKFICHITSQALMPEKKTDCDHSKV